MERNIGRSNITHECVSWVACIFTDLYYQLYLQDQIKECMRVQVILPIGAMWFALSTTIQVSSRYVVIYTLVLFPSLIPFIG